MTQNWTADSYAAGHVAQTDLQNMENNFLTLKSLFSGTSTPANTVAGMPWFDTGKDLLRLRDTTNGSWYGVMHADASQEIWVYRNDAMSGWVINSNVADKVIALKGGSNAYNVTGGTTAGTWQQPGHTLSQNEMPSHNHGGSVITNQANVEIYTSTSYEENGGDIYLDNNAQNPSWTSSLIRDTGHSHSISTAGGGYSHNHGLTYRPNAAVGTLQRMDV